MAWKYVMLEIAASGTSSQPGGVHKVPVIFAPEITHQQVADGVKRGIGFDRHSRAVSVEAVNAGFVSFNGVDREKAVSVWGDSESTGLKSDPRDAEIIHEVARRNPYFY